MEWLTTPRENPPQMAVFDFDGTISTLRQGWETIMRPLMLEVIAPGGADDALEREVDDYIDRSTGIQTVYQMQWLAERVKSYGQNPVCADAWDYKDEYNRRLKTYIRDRLNAVRSGAVPPEEFLIAGSVEFLQRLKKSGTKLYVASGTDHEDVVSEVAVLALSGFFDGIAGAPHRQAACSKEAVIRNLLEKQNMLGQALMVVGDGKVEITLGKEAGAFTVGTATDEAVRRGINEVKRRRLIEAGADLIIGDFTGAADIFTAWKEEEV